MTKKEILDDLNKIIKQDTIFTMAEVKDLVVQICDNYEGRSCEGCKFKEACRLVELISYDYMSIDELKRLSNDFSCNKWEAK